MTRESFIVDTSELGRRPGTMTTTQRTITAPDRFGNDVIAIASGQQIDLDLRLEAVMEGVLATGTVSSRADGICGRCLRPISQDIGADISELFVYPEREEAADQDEDPSPLVSADETIDIEGPVTDAIVPALPFQPLCRPDCPGLCAVCGVDLATAEPGHGHAAPIDPRWAKLAPLAEGAPSSHEEHSDDGEDGHNR